MQTYSDDDHDDDDDSAQYHALNATDSNNINK